jgi:hypothetical protein
VSVLGATNTAIVETEVGMTRSETVRIVRDQLVLGPVTVEFQRTLRIPETGLHPLPPGLGRFPLRRVADPRHRAT